MVENIIRIVFYEEKRNTKIKNLSNRWYQFEKKDLEKHRQLLIVNRISCNELNHIHIAAIRGKIPITNMSVVIYCNGKYYLQIIAKKS